MTTRHAPAATPINRTGHAENRRVTGSEGIHTDTVASGLSCVTKRGWGRSCQLRPHQPCRGATAHPRFLRHAEGGDRCAPSYAHGPHLLPRHPNHHRRSFGGDLMSAPSPGPTSVYRYYDRLGALIYVGITNRGVQRNLEHNLDKDWWQFVVRQEVDHCATRKEALRRERALIIRHRPPFNRQHNPDSDNLRAIYLAFTSAAPGDGDPLATWKDAGKQVTFGIHSVDVAARQLILRTDVAMAPVAQHIRAEENLHLYHRKDQGHTYGAVTFEGGCVQDLAYLVAVKFARYIPPFRSAHAPVRVVSLKQPVTFRLTAVYLKWETYGERPNGAVA